MGESLQHIIHSETFWVAVSFVLFMALFVKFAGKLILSALDKRSEGIKEELDEALQLKEEAQALLASYQKKQKDIEQEAQHIIKAAEEEAKRIHKESEEALETSLNHRIEMAMAKIASYEASIVNELRSQAVDEIVDTVRLYLQEKVSDKKVQSALLDQSLSEIKAKL